MPEANVPLQGRQGSRGCIPDAPGETGIHLEWKQRTPLCSRVATGISGSSLGGLKGVKPPEAFGERSRDWSLGHAGDEGPPLKLLLTVGVALVAFVKIRIIEEISWLRFILWPFPPLADLAALFTDVETFSFKSLVFYVLLGGGYSLVLFSINTYLLKKRKFSS